MNDNIYDLTLRLSTLDADERERFHAAALAEIERRKDNGLRDILTQLQVQYTREELDFMGHDDLLDVLYLASGSEGRLREIYQGGLFSRPTN